VENGAGCCRLDNNLFQLTLIVSGNLSWLNYITIALCIPCFDDAFLSWVSGFVTQSLLTPRWRTASPSMYCSRLCGAEHPANHQSFLTDAAMNGQF